MYCEQCGKLISEQARFCPGCGAKITIPPTPAAYVRNGEKRTSGSAAPSLARQITYSCAANLAARTAAAGRGKKRSAKPIMAAALALLILGGAVGTVRNVSALASNTSEHTVDYTYESVIFPINSKVCENEDDSSTDEEPVFEVGDEHIFLDCEQVSGVDITDRDSVEALLNALYPDCMGNILSCKEFGEYAGMHWWQAGLLNGNVGSEKYQTGHLTVYVGGQEGSDEYILVTAEGGSDSAPAEYAGAMVEEARAAANTSAGSAEETVEETIEATAEESESSEFEDAVLLEDGDFACYEKDDGTAYLAAYTGTERDLEIPSELCGMTLTEIGEEAFGECDTLVSVVIPDTVDSIWYNPFYLCENLERIEVSSGNERYTSISGVLFDRTEKSLKAVPTGLPLDSYEIPDGITSIGKNAFYCSTVTEVTLPDSLTFISSDAFCVCRLLKSIRIPEQVSTIGRMAFFGCLSLENITVDAMNGCYYAEDGVLFETDTKALLEYPIGKRDTSYEVPEGTPAIRAGAFAGSPSLTEVVIASDTVTIEGNAFFYCENLESVVIPSGVEEIVDDPFTYSDNVILTVEKGSAAETWAEDNGYTYTVVH